MQVGTLSHWGPGQKKAHSLGEFTSFFFFTINSINYIKMQESVVDRNAFFYSELEVM